MSLVALQEAASALDSAIELAEDAVKSAEASMRAITTPTTVRLVKVAHSKYESVAASLVKTGAFRADKNSLVTFLKQADENSLLETLEKLASQAVFPIDASDVSSWNFVEKSESSRDQAVGKPSTFSVWKRAWDDAKAEHSG